MRFLKVISSGYFHEDHLKGITNPKFQLSIISSTGEILQILKCTKNADQDFTDLEFESAIFSYIFMIFMLQN